MKLTILGCGSSVGVPSISCKCDICCSQDWRNKRSRTSALIEDKTSKILIDTGPDVRKQAIDNSITQVNGIVYTHVHADHINGIDDLRSFEPTNTTKNFIPIYGDDFTLNTLKVRSPHMFNPILPETKWNKSFLMANTINYYETFTIDDISITAFPQEHGEITSLGLIFNQRIAYCTDVKKLPEESYDLLKQVEVLVIECLGYKETAAHAHFDLTLKLIEKIKPKTALLTHMGHEIDYATITTQLNNHITQHNLPTQIIVPYDGYTIEI